MRRTLAIGIATWLSSCSINLGGTQERRILDLGKENISYRARVAQEYVTEQQLAALRRRAKERFPVLTDGDLASIGLSWQRTNFADGEHVMVIVTFMPRTKGVNGAAVADYLVQTMRSDIAPKLGQGAAAERRGAADEARDG